MVHQPLTVSDDTSEAPSVAREIEAQVEEIHHNLDDFLDNLEDLPTSLKPKVKLWLQKMLPFDDLDIKVFEDIGVYTIRDIKRFSFHSLESIVFNLSDPLVAYKNIAKVILCLHILGMCCYNEGLRDLRKGNDYPDDFYILNVKREDVRHHLRKLKTSMRSKVQELKQLLHAKWSDQPDVLRHLNLDTPSSRPNISGSTTPTAGNTSRSRMNAPDDEILDYTSPTNPWPGSRHSRLDQPGRHPEFLRAFRAKMRAYQPGGTDFNFARYLNERDQTSQDQGGIRIRIRRIRLRINGVLMMK